MPSDDLKKLDVKLQLKQISREGSEALEAEEKKAFESISERYEKMRIKEEQLYRAEYKTRVEVERRNLIDKAGSKTIQPAPRFAFGDRFNNRDLTRQAQLNVRSQHNQTMGRLDAQELKESKTFLEDSSKSKEFKEVFKQSAERRRSETRRQSPERRRTPTESMSD